MKLELEVEDIHCAGCAANIVFVLQSIAGVKDASVDLRSRRVEVVYAPPLSEDQILAELAKAEVKAKKWGASQFEATRPLSPVWPRSKQS